jgi:hypothetical protein
MKITALKIWALQIAPENKMAIYSETALKIFIKFQSFMKNITLNIVYRSHLQEDKAPGA